ncbi:MAG: hypothetical protein CVU84_09155 [Firmicutes bacterium HGW-Firmicutes-1]|jgi:nitrogenase cofactor biosynthesis protein NifB|nr:MAG: hypothetical protein CVU84_09155 [Firmicutes bacterium HGW-Firmicutes-1]
MLKCNNNTPLNKQFMSSELKEKTAKHPCYNPDAIDYARMHLPVAPKCNVQCNYCNRKYDCQNESRPGVTSMIMSPKQSFERYKEEKLKYDKLTVVGFAGPGDAMANFEEVKETIELIKEYDATAIFCLSTNGLALYEHIDEVIQLGVSHITITINTIYPEVAAQIYKFIDLDGKRYTGIEAGEIIVKRQFEALEKLCQNNVMVKVNIVYIKGLNDNHIDKVVERAATLGVAMTNIMPLIPTENTAFAEFPKPSATELLLVRKKCEKYVTQMYHCKQCRADAVGTLCGKKQIG